MGEKAEQETDMRGAQARIEELTSMLLSVQG